MSVATPSTPARALSGRAFGKYGSKPAFASPACQNTSFHAILRRALDAKVAELEVPGGDQWNQLKHKARQ